MGSIGTFYFPIDALVFISAINGITNVNCFVHFFLWCVNFKAVTSMGNFLLIGWIFLMLLIRPNSLSLVPAILLVIFFNRNALPKWCLVGIITLISFISLYFLIYYTPYFFMVQDSSTTISYWGITTEEYSKGLFQNLPLLLNKLISYGILTISKLFYASGLRPSYSEVTTILVFLRGIGGILILPGIFYCFYKGSWFERVLVFCFLFPLLITVAQERYLLPIAPLLLMYGGFFGKIFTFLYVNLLANEDSCFYTNI